MNSLLIVGAGGHGRVVADTALACKKYERIAFVDDQFDKLGSVLNLPVLGPISSALDLTLSFLKLLLPWGIIGFAFSYWEH